MKKGSRKLAIQNVTLLACKDFLWTPKGGMSLTLDLKVSVHLTATTSIEEALEQVKRFVDPPKEPSPSVTQAPDSGTVPVSSSTVEIDDSISTGHIRGPEAPVHKPDKPDIKDINKRIGRKE